MNVLNLNLAVRSHVVRAHESVLPHVYVVLKTGWFLEGSGLRNIALMWHSCV